MEIPFALAFTAGLVATVNPCGFAMLPAYLAYFMGTEDQGRTHGPRTVGRGLVVGGVVSAGFLTVFGVAGVLITLGVQAVVGALPWAAMVVGVAVALLGVAMLAGLEPASSLPKLASGGPSRGLGGVYVFGLSYAVASLSCTLPIFLVVVAGTIPQLGFLSVHNPGLVALGQDFAMEHGPGHRQLLVDGHPGNPGGASRIPPSARTTRVPPTVRRVRRRPSSCARRRYVSALTAVRCRSARVGRRARTRVPVNRPDSAEGNGGPGGTADATDAKEPL